MKQLRLPIFTSKIKYYNLRVVPSDPVYTKVTELKKKFERSYGKQPLSRSKPHITIAAFKMNSKYEDLLISILGQLSKKKAFKLHIDGFDVFEGSKTLYLNVVKNEAMEAIHTDVRTLHRQHLKGKLKSCTIAENPHMTISTTTGKKMLYESLHYFQRNDYSEQLQVDLLTLVSRSKYKTWDWEHKILLA